tara:strand:- start:8127 stop:8474 length:348 start_codon:yes stop_codon:yes gene_type:complete
MSKDTAYIKSSLDTNSFEPFMIGDKQAGEVHWLTTENSSGAPAYSGIWRCEPMTFDYEFPGDEVFHVIEGDLSIKVTDGETVNVTAGDIISFAKGIKSTWTINRTFRKFFAISNC